MRPWSEGGKLLFGGIQRMERHLEERSKAVDHGTLLSASSRALADYRVMLAVAEICSASCGPGPARGEGEAARCSAECQTAKETGVVARAGQCRALDWLR